MKIKIIHLPDEYSNSINILHELGHIVFDILVETKDILNEQSKYEDEVNKAGYESFEEYLCDSFVDFIQRMKVDEGLTEDLNEERKVTNYDSFDYYFKYTAPKSLERLPDSPDVPRMLHYNDKYNQEDVFLSHDHAVPELTFIRCNHAEEAYQSPYCKVETQYRYETSNNKNSDKKITPFYLNYSFARSYLPQWREIDRKLKALYDQFAQSAEKHP